MGRLEGRVAIVTGAGSGIGEATVPLMAREGALIVVADLNRAEASALPANSLQRGAVSNATEETSKRPLQNYPMPRLCAPEDVANAVDFLASDEAAYINAATLMVDGGATVCMSNAQLRSGARVPTW